MELPATTKEITVEWLNEVLHENEFLGNNNIVALSRDPVGDGKGFHSDMARLFLTYDKPIDNLPLTMIAKLPISQSPLPRGVITGAFEREINSYTKITSQSSIRVPKIIFSDMQPNKERYILLMEDCGNYEEADPDLKGLSYIQAKIITEKIAAFHARWWDDDELSALSALIDVSVNIDEELLKELWETCTKKGDLKTVLPDDEWEVGYEILAKYNQLLSNKRSKNLTICYYDFKPDNMFFDWKTPDNPLIILDWGGARLSIGPYDLATVVGFCLPIETRKKHEKELIKIYHNQLMENGVLTYSYEECWEDYLTGLLVRSSYPILLFSLHDENGTERINIFARQAFSRWFSAIMDNDAIRLLPK